MRLAVHFILPSLTSGSWTPTDAEIALLHTNPKRRKIENNSVIGERDFPRGSGILVMPHTCAGFAVDLDESYTSSEYCEKYKRPSLDEDGKIQPYWLLEQDLKDFCTCSGF